MKPTGKAVNHPVDYDRLLMLSAELGYRLLLSGAEIYRVEESVRYLLEAYDVRTGEVFAIPNCIIVSLATQGQKPLTRVRRVPSHGTDIRRMEALNDLCRKLCRDKPTLDEAWVRLESVLSDGVNFSQLWRLMAYSLGPLAFCLFFGGSGWDALCSGLCGLCTGLCLTFMDRLGTNLFFRTIIGGFVSAFLAMVLTYAGLGQNSGVIITGAIMNLVPGIVITNFMRDVMAGDMLSGLTKLADSLLTATGIALGTGLAITFTRLFWGVL